MPKTSFPFPWDFRQGGYMHRWVVFFLAAGDLSAAPTEGGAATAPDLATSWVVLVIFAALGWGLFVWMRLHSAAQLASALKRENHFRILFERSPDCVLLFDFATARFSGCNNAALKLLACTPDWLIGRTPWELAPPLQPDGIPSIEKARQIIAKLGPTKSLNFEWTHSRGDGSSFPADISATAIEFSGKEVWFCVVRDITEAKRTEAQARELQSSLERRVVERTEDLARANSQLREVEQLLRNALAAEKELNALKTNFVSMVSHEFRTPLGVILMSAEVLNRYFERLRPEQRADHLKDIISSVRRMAGMMEDVLLLGRVEAGAVNFSPTEINLRVLCGRVVDEVRSATNATCPVNVKFESDMPYVASGDNKLIHHILTNLLSNAIKYSKQEPVELRLKRADQQAVIEIEDRGIGIPAADQERLFQTFQRGGNVGQVSGTGLGLVIVKRCCEVHGGTITFHSEENRGTTFMVSLPMFDKENT